MEQFSQISTIKRVNKGNLHTNYKQHSQLKYSRQSSLIKQNESMNIQRLLTTIVKQPSEFSNQNYITVTNSSQFHQRKLNSSGGKNSRNSFCLSTLNETNPNLAIQSEPNTMLVGFSSYFQVEQYDYGSRIKPLTYQKQLSIRKIFKFLINIDLFNYLKKQIFHRIRQLSIRNIQVQEKSLQARQFKYIDLVLNKKQDKYWHQKTHTNINIPYYNKLMALCNPQLIVRKKVQMIENNVKKFKVIKQLQGQISKLVKKQDSYEFNFEIHARPPLYFQKRLNDNNYSPIKRNT